MATTNQPAIDTSDEYMFVSGTVNESAVVPVADTVEHLRQPRYGVRLHDAGPPFRIGVMRGVVAEEYMVACGPEDAEALQDLQFRQVTAGNETAITMTGWPPVRVTVTPVDVVSGEDAVRLSFDRTEDPDA